MSFLLDTNIVSELRKPECNPGVFNWYESVRREQLYLSVLLLGEIQQGINRLHLRNDPDQARIFETWLHTVRTTYRARVLEIDSEIAERWGDISHLRTLPVVDGLMAATANVHRLTLVTRNTAHFTDTGTRLLNPFT